MSSLLARLGRFSARHRWGVLVVAGTTAITEMVVAAAFVVAVAVLLSLTLLPAFMGIMGTRALSRKQRAALKRGEIWREGSEQKRGAIRGWSSVIVKKPITSIIGGLMLLVIVALPGFDMKIAANVPGGSDPESTERAAYNLILDEFGGTQSPLVVLAFGLMVGVAADAFIVRMVLMPAVLSLLGSAAWWMPKWLDRILPNVDVEGSSLDKREKEMALAS